MEDYVSFEQAKALKELGFNWEVGQYYNPDKTLWFPEENGGCDFNYFDDGRYSAPTLYQVKKWLWENNCVLIEEVAFIACNHEIIFQPIIWINNDPKSIVPAFKDFDKALSSALNWALKIIKEYKA